MRVLVIYAHPVETSFNAAVHERALNGLNAAGHDVDDCDLYAERFDPVLSRAERVDYHDESENRKYTQPYIDRLMQADGVMFVFPTWSMTPPAIVKGFFDRVLVPGVAFKLTDDGRLEPTLKHIRSVGAAITYGQRWLPTTLFGNPSKRLITRYFRFFAGKDTRSTFLPYYNMNIEDPARLSRFLDRVETAMANF